MIRQFKISFRKKSHLTDSCLRSHRLKDIVATIVFLLSTVRKDNVDLGTHFAYKSEQSNESA